MLADSFRDYPAWLSIGPRRERARWRMLDRFYRGALARAATTGASFGAYADDRLIAAAIVYPPGGWPPSAASFFHEAWGIALSGPGASIRGLRAATAIDAVHPAEPHAFLHTLGVHPSAQRSGAGSALVHRTTADADATGVPVHLTTSTDHNLPYYRRFGFEVDGEATLPRGVPLWSMLRPGRR